MSKAKKYLAAMREGGEEAKAAKLVKQCADKAKTPMSDERKEELKKKFAANMKK